MKSIMNTAVISILFAALLFRTIEISWGFYFTIFLILIALSFINFKLSENHDLYISLLTINFSIFVVYCISNFNKNNKVVETASDKLYLLLIFLSLVAISYLLICSKLSKEKIEKNKPILIKKREKDLKIVMDYLESFKIIGLNGRWGTGKSFIVDALKDRVKDEYEFIEIDLLTSNLNEMQSTLIKGLEEIMYKNRILPKYASQMKNNIESSSIVSRVQDVTNLIFKNSNSSSEVLQEFQKELSKLDKKILVIYEDIDRISNTDVIREVFSISERISSENIKIIYQYDESIMENLGLNQDYLEKYIPFKVNLTELHFREILQFELRNIDASILSIEDFDFLRNQATQFTVLQDFFEFDGDYIMEVKYIPIRKVKQLIGELVIILQLKQELYIDHKETVISFYLLKHLHWEAYKKLDIQEGLLDAIKFKVEGEKHYSILQLIRLFKEEKINQENLKEIFSSKKNKENYSILKLFQYKILNPEKYRNKERFSILEEEAKHWNEKIDRIIWNLSYEGKSMFTDFENAAHKLSNEVLSKPKEERRLAYQDFWSYFFYADDITIDNTTIFKIGSSGFLELFKSFKVANISNDNQIKLVDFYFEYNNLKKIDLELIKCLNYCPLQTTVEYLNVLKHVNALEVIGNLRREEEFSKFLNKYIHALTSLGYFHSYYYFDDIKELIENQDFVLRVFKKMIEDLNGMKLRHQQVQLQSTTDDLKVIILFLQKMINVLKCEEELVSEKRSYVRTEFTSRKRNQEEFDRLQELMESEGDNIIEEIEVSYVNKKITLYEANELLGLLPDSLKY